MDKKKWRREIISERKNLDEKLRKRYSELIAEEIFSHYSHRVVCSYVAFRGEVDLETLHLKIRGEGRILLLPYVVPNSNTMLFCEVASLDDLRISPMGIPEPDPKTCKVWDYEEIWESEPLVLTPGVAFTKNGDRMGYGGGFYDRFFETSRGRGIKLGVCYRMQLRDTLPTEPHDIKVDEVIYAPQKVLLGLSGGVDSAVAAYLLKESGYEVAGVYFRMWKPGDTGAGDAPTDTTKYTDASAAGDMDIAAAKNSGTDAPLPDGVLGYTLLEEGIDENCHLSVPDIMDAYLVAKRLDIPLYSCDLRTEFRDEVVEYFAREYLAGRTPNPCIYCNRKIKFHSLIRMANLIGAERIATGHYARISLNENTGRYEILAPEDRKKDQGYMLSGLSQEQLSRLLTPLSGMRDKSEVREIAAGIGLHISEKKDSQEICFVDQTYLEVLKHLGYKGKKGSFVLDGKAVREHCGIEQYTVGQRKGLGAFGRPVFVVNIDGESGDVLLGDHKDLFSREVFFGNLNYVALPEGDEIGRCTAKIRYAAQKEPCTVEKLCDFKVRDSEIHNSEICCDSYVARFDEPQRAATPGQIIVFYDGDKILASGVIERSGRSI